MNHASSKKWLQEKLLPSLESKSVTVVDNVPDHNVQINQNPTSNARKAEILFWLDKHSSDITKVELYDFIKMHKPQYETFSTDCSPSMDTQ
jgi:hypothetical protein